MEMPAYFAKMAAARRESPGEDLISLLVNGDTEEGRLEDWEVIGFTILLLIAGNETTTNLMSNSLNFLAQRPDVFAQLRADRSLIEPFIEEMLRYESPVQVLFRETAKEAHLPSGAVIPAGEPVGVFYGAANRDPAAWDEPDTFRLDRNLKDHVAFGHGIHYCLGSPLARMEARITLNNLCERYREVRPGSAPAVRQTASPVVFGFRTLPIEFVR
jgi:cytochrome P450